MLREEAPHVEVFDPITTVHVVKCRTLTQSSAEESIRVVATNQGVAAEEVVVVGPGDGGQPLEVWFGDLGVGTAGRVRHAHTMPDG